MIFFHDTGFKRTISFLESIDFLNENLCSKIFLLKATKRNDCPDLKHFSQVTNFWRKANTLLLRDVLICFSLVLKVPTKAIVGKILLFYLKITNSKKKHPY